jgi:hypothetical protein
MHVPDYAGGPGIATRNFCHVPRIPQQKNLRHVIRQMNGTLLLVIFAAGVRTSALHRRHQMNRI